MTVYLTSFKRWHQPNPNDDIAGPDIAIGRAYSIAVYQPDWFPQLPKLNLFDIRDENKQWVRPRNFMPAFEFASGDLDTDVGNPNAPNQELLKRYHDTLVGIYEERWHRGDNTDILLREQDTALCCWCPYDKAAQRQLEDYGSFVCHSWPVETFLKGLGVEVVRDADRGRMVT